MNIDELRGEINGIDDQLLSLFERRMEIAGEIGRIKKEKSLPIQDAERERALLRRMYAKAKPETAEYVEPLFLSLMEMSRDYQARQD
ncbi:MAG: chorismate mutase [Treponema sp.]|jgi:monofunctional chorismate mutase|nr:chorismate mutase [Treponema sp.]